MDDIKEDWVICKRMVKLLIVLSIARYIDIDRLYTYINIDIDIDEIYIQSSFADLRRGCC